MYDTMIKEERSGIADHGLGIYPKKELTLRERWLSLTTVGEYNDYLPGMKASWTGILGATEDFDRVYLRYMKSQKGIV